MLAAIFGPALARDLPAHFNPLWYPDDARQHIYPLFRLADPELFRGDYVVDYLWNVTLPVGLRLLYGLLVPLADPGWIARVLPFVLYVLTLGFACRAAERLGGRTAALLTAALLLSSPFFAEAVTGGYQRSFALPLLAAALFFLVEGRPRALAAVTAAGAALYPPVGVLAGLALAIVLLAPRARHRFGIEAGAVRERLFLVSAAAALSALLVLPPLLAGSAYGPRVGPGDVGAFPEAGPGGRYPPRSRPPHAGLPAELSRSLSQALVGGGAPAVPWAARLVDRRSRSGKQRHRLAIAAVGILTVFGAAALAREGVRGRRALALAAAACLAYAAARVFDPLLYVPNRYVAYAGPLLVAVLFPAGAAGLARLVPALARRRLAPPAAAVAIAGAAFALLGCRGSYAEGLTIRIRPGTELYRFIAGLPRTSLVAGFPSGPVDNVPYLARRGAYLAWETHHAFHPAYLLEMRRRMRRFLAAYFADRAGPLLELRDREGVTHLIVERWHFGERLPRYFEPFRPMIAAAAAGLGDRGRAEVLRQEGAVVFAEGPVVVLDLSRLEGPTGVGAGP